MPELSFCYDHKALENDLVLLEPFDVGTDGDDDIQR